MDNKDSLSAVRKERWSDGQLSELKNEFKDYKDEFTAYKNGADFTLKRCSERFNEVIDDLEILQGDLTNVKQEVTRTGDLVKESNKLLSGISVLELKLDFENNKLEQEKRWVSLVRMVDSNTHTNEEMLKEIGRLNENTKGVVELSKTLDSLVKLGVGVRKLILWGAPIFAVAVASTAWVWVKISSFFG